METYPIYWPQFCTATILEWKPLLKPAKYKDVIILLEIIKQTPTEVAALVMNRRESGKSSLRRMLQLMLVVEFSNLWRGTEKEWINR